MRRGGLFGLAVLVAAFALPTGAGASGIHPGSGPRPGPPLLYKKPTTAPQLRNAGIWHAKPILVSGASAYRRGEFLYQDFLYDDHGARAVSRDPSDPRSGSDTFSAPNGTYTYPTADQYKANVADIVELRAKPLARSTAFRVTFDSMTDPGLVGTTIALGSSKTARELPYGAGASAPAKRFLVVHGKRGVLLNAKSLKPIKPAPTVHVSVKRRQVEVRVPKRAWNPKRRKVRMAAAAGLWDVAAGKYLTPGTSATATQPGGAAGLATPTALFNVAFRFHEPLPTLAVPDVITNASWWRDKAQGAALAANDLSSFFAKVDFGKLHRHVNDDMRNKPTGVPTKGAFNRIYSSRFSYGQGVDFGVSCMKTSKCSGQYLGRLMPYAVYIPHRRVPKRGYGTQLLLHSLGATYNQFLGTRNQSEFGDRGRGYVTLSALNRGPDGWYYGPAGADTFEMWADAAKHYKLDPHRSALAGYSMGGYATYKYAAQFPGLFSAAQPTVGPPGLGVWVPPGDPVPGGAPSNTNAMLASVRNLPFLIWDGAADELVPVASALAQAQTFDDLGYRYRFDLFLATDHFALAINDQFAPAAKFLGDRRVPRNPFHVTYVRNPSMDFPKLGTRAQNAYWVSKIKLRDKNAGGGLGKLDAIDHAFGRTDPAPAATQHTVGTLSGGDFYPPPGAAFGETSKSWSKAGQAPKRKRLEIDLTNIGSATIDAKRSRLGCHPKVDATSDGPAKLHLAGCSRTISVG